MNRNMINTPCYRERQCGRHGQIVAVWDCTSVKQVRRGFIIVVQLTGPAHACTECTLFQVAIAYASDLRSSSYRFAPSFPLFGCGFPFQNNVTMALCYSRYTAGECL